MWSILTSLPPLLPAQAAQPSLLGMLTPWILILVIFYFILWRPAQKKQREHQEMLNAIKKGDKVITNGGIYGKVTKVDDGVVVLEVADNLRIRVSRRAIAGFEGEAEPPEAQ
ncbi:MAG: preprotein translocase subunit YajC [Thermoanaerobaculia bacterium]|nr:preprotein translocase subunit YajC [Thermoanaerobaculia bacterium]